MRATFCLVMFEEASLGQDQGLRPVAVSSPPESRVADMQIVDVPVG